MAYIVRESFMQAHFGTPTLRHYFVPAASPEQALSLVRNSAMIFGSVLYGCVPGSQLSVVAQVDQMQNGARLPPQPVENPVAARKRPETI